MYTLKINHGSGTLKWTREELILALSFYFKNGYTKFNKNSPEILELSECIKNLNAYPKEMQYANFRSAASVYAKLGNFCSLDPEYDGKALSNGSKLDKIVWDEFVNNKQTLFKLANELHKNLKNFEKEETWLETIIEAFQILGGDAKYRDLYPVVRSLRLKKKLSWTPKSKHSIQATIKEHSSDSIKNKNHNKKNIFKKFARGHWGLLTKNEFINVEPEEEQIDAQLQRQINNYIIKINIKDFEYQAQPRTIEEVKIKSGKTTIKRNILRQANALAKANYLCEYNKRHKLFLRKKININYTEPHHLIPLKFYKSFKYSLDTEENIVSLCSHCHNQLHYGKDIMDILTKLYNQRKKLLESAGIFIEFEELVKMYK